MDFLVAALRQHPELAVFAALALGYWLGARQLGSFRLGPVTGVLLAGVLIGQLEIAISPNVKAVFFLMFLFAVGYDVGPQFVRGLKTGGVPQAGFAVLQCLVSLAIVYAVAVALGYDAGTAAGLLAGSQTSSAVLGVAGGAIDRLAIADADKALLGNRVPVAYAVTYLFGAAGSGWVLSSIGPKLLRVNLAAACKELEASLGSTDSQPMVISAARRIDARAFRVSDSWVSQSVAALEERWKGSRTTIERIRRDGAIRPAEPSSTVRAGDVIAVVGRREVLVEADLGVGPEVHDFELLDFPSEALDVVITSRAVAGRTILELADSEEGRSRARGVYLTGLVRGGEEMPFTAGTTLDRGDVLRIVGAQRNVARAAEYLGYADRATNATDLVFVGAGIALGGLVGTLSVEVGGTPLSLGTSAGALLAGLLFGWLRSVNRTFGRVPAPALWILNNLGLTAFIAVVGISAGPSFVSGLRDSGLSLIFAGIVSTTVPLVFGVLTARYAFGFHPAIALGAAAGAQTATAALGMIQNAAQSKAPALGYTVPYAVSAILIAVWGTVIVLLMQSA